MITIIPNETGLPIVGAKVRTKHNKIVKLKAKCAYCRFAKQANEDKEYESILAMLKDDDYLVCKFNTAIDTLVDDNHCCNSFEFADGVLNDVYNGC